MLKFAENRVGTVLLLRISNSGSVTILTTPYSSKSQGVPVGTLKILTVGKQIQMAVFYCSTFVLYKTG